MHTLIFNIGLIPCKQVVVLDIKTISTSTHFVQLQIAKGNDILKAAEALRKLI